MTGKAVKNPEDYVSNLWKLWGEKSNGLRRAYFDNEGTVLNFPDIEQYEEFRINYWLTRIVCGFSGMIGNFSLKFLKSTIAKDDAAIDAILNELLVKLDTSEDEFTHSHLESVMDFFYDMVTHPDYETRIARLRHVAETEIGPEVLYNGGYFLPQPVMDGGIIEIPEFER